ncbi:MAG: glycosyltransferase family 9 protein [Gammaproteobacteria bacterium]|nr:glycosyltransferase family 9 protein [Gammaproteobacteria bacterium]
MSLSIQSPPESICVIRLSAIGDCCHTLPVIRTIQAAWPETRITWVIGETEFQLMNGVDGVDFITFDKRRGIHGLREIRARLRGKGFPLLLHMHASMRANFVSRMIPANIRIGFDRRRARDFQWLFTNQRIPWRPEQHVMDGLFGFVEFLGLKERVLRWDIPISEPDRQFASDAVGESTLVVAISPCTSQRFRNYRNWRAENFAAVAQYAHETYGAEIILTGAATQIEQEYGAAITAEASVPVKNLIGKTTLKQLLAILDRADLLICPDSGPAHMATTVGTPVIGLYATSNPGRTGPYNSLDLVVNRYPEAVNKEFGKPVNSLRWGQRVRDPDAMDLIRVGNVTAQIDIVLRSDRISSNNR